jgi:hypothetical protein
MGIAAEPRAASAEQAERSVHGVILEMLEQGPALDAAVKDAVLDTFAAPAPSATTRSKLLILHALDTTDAADRAAVAWNRLSNACHVHAYEMQPSTAEVEQLCGVVAGLLP